MSKVKVYRKYYKDGSIGYERYCLNDKLHREDGPAYIGYNKDGSIRYEMYYLNGKQHREDGPASINYSIDGSIDYEIYYLNDKEVEPFKVIKATNLAKRLYPNIEEKEGYLYV